jgi:hypothetical protein
MAGISPAIDSSAPWRSLFHSPPDAAAWRPAFPAIVSNQPTPTAEKRLTGELVPLFNSRREPWDQHFAWSADFLDIYGLSALGRATAARLRFSGAIVVDSDNSSAAARTRGSSCTARFAGLCHSTFGQREYVGRDRGRDLPGCHTNGPYHDRNY